MSGKQVPKREIKGFICYSSLKQILKVATTEATTCTLHLTISTWIALENYNNNDQQFNTHGSLFRSQSLSLGFA